MAEIVNLRRARKAEARAEHAKAADANRAVHGRTLAERAREASDRARAEKAIDQAKRER